MMKTYYRPQLTPVTCYAACLQMALGYSGVRIGHMRAITELGNPLEGITAERFDQCLRKLSNDKLVLTEVKKPLSSLQNGNLVVSYISITEPCDHAVIISDYRVISKDRIQYYVLDPLPWKIGWKEEDYFEDFFFEVEPQ